MGTKFANLLIAEEKKGWVALMAPKNFDLYPAFKTERIGKIVDDYELQFPIGATREGQAHSLNESIIQYAGQTSEDRFTTNGNLRNGKLYPTIVMTAANEAQVHAVCHQVMGAILQVKQTADRNRGI